MAFPTQGTCGGFFEQIFHVLISPFFSFHFRCVFDKRQNNVRSIGTPFGTITVAVTDPNRPSQFRLTDVKLKDVASVKTDNGTKRKTPFGGVAFSAANTGTAKLRFFLKIYIFVLNLLLLLLFLLLSLLLLSL